MATDEAVSYIRDSLPKLLRILQESDVRELELRDGDLRVRLHRTMDDEATVVAWDQMEEPAAQPPVACVTAPLVGTFYRAGKPGMPPLVQEGSHVQEDTVVGIIEALSVLTEVEAGCTGTVTKVLATDGEPVEYGQSLFEVMTGG